MCFKAQDHEGSSQTELATFLGKLLEFEDIRSTGSPELVDWFFQRLSAMALVLGATTPELWI